MSESSNDTADRFEFGKNWSNFLSILDEDRIEVAKRSLQDNLGLKSLEHKTVLDIGSGSGLFSLAAHRLGAKVVSFDYDRNSVECTTRVRESFALNVSDWDIQQGSVLDEEFMKAFGLFDVVYSWGVLHHTGNLDKALTLARQRVKPNGKFFIAIYNDEGVKSRIWLRIKQIYNRLPTPIRPVYVFGIALYHELKVGLKRLVTFQNPLSTASTSKHRGMSIWYDWVDWIGGLPFEVAKPDDIINSLRKNGFVLDKITTVGTGWGCNEFVFHHDQSKKETTET